MPIHNGTILTDGALIEILVGVAPAVWHAATTAGQNVPGPFRVSALIDPGTSQTCIDQGLVTSLGLVAQGTRAFYTPTAGGVAQTLEEFEVTLTLLHPAMNFSRGGLRVVAATLAVQGFEVLLGRDVLRDCLFVYNGPAGTFSLAF
jgi:hypothetical protein